MHAEHGLHLRELGKYLIHSECDGRPHCIAVEVLEDSSCTVYDGDQQANLSISEVHVAFDKSLDRSTVVTIALTTDPADQPDALLEMRAAGRWRGQRTA